MNYVGVDMSKKKSQIAVKDEKGELQSEFKIVNTKESFVSTMKRLKGPVELVCETGNKCFWLADIMKEIGVGVQVAHAYKVKLIAEARIKTDKVDARTLAELRRVNFIPEVYIPSQDIRTWREIVRGRSHFVRIRTQMYNRIHAVMDRYAIEYDTRQLHMSGAVLFIESLELPQPVKAAVKEYLELITEIDEHAKKFEKMLKEKVKLDGAASNIINLLQTIPGIGWLSAFILYLELADIKRFKNIKKLCSFVGIIPGVYQSGNVHRGGHLTKQGNSFLRWIITEDAWQALRSSNYHDGLYKHHSKKLGKSKAILPVARALLYAVYQVWSQGKKYEDIFK